MLTRRDFLNRSALVALAPSIPGFLARTLRGAEAQRDGRILVVVELNGGNDGINTVVPYADEGYARNRKALRLPTDQLVKVNDQVGLHPSLRDAAKLLEDGHLGIVQGVGYPNPNRSHFRSMAIWHTARFDPEEHNGLGWIGRALDERPKDQRAETAALLVGSGSPPVALRGRRSVVSAIERLDDFALTGPSGQTAGHERATQPGDALTGFVRRTTLDAYTTAERLAALAGKSASGATYPAGELAAHLQLVARLIKADLGTRVFYTVQTGYDTHSQQLPLHARLLRELADALRAFIDDLSAAGLADRVLVMTFSEFGRRVQENGSAGTDHGTAGPVFLAGGKVNGGLHGPTPSLSDLEAGDLKIGIDFRQVYASVLHDWLRLRAAPALGGTFAPLPLLRT
jgi:uncharacterized protein (DUF1501 family)